MTVENSKALIISNQDELIMDVQHLLAIEEIESDVETEFTSSFNKGYTYSVFIFDESAAYAIDKEALPQPAIIYVLLTEKSYEKARFFLRKGMTNVFVYPDERELFQQEIFSAIEELRAKQRKSKDLFGKGNVHAFYSAKGGTGKTLLASMFAQYLQVQHDKKVALIDLNAQFGGVEALFSIEPARSYYDLRPVLAELSINHIENIAVTESKTGLTLILGPANPQRAEEINEELISAVIRTCQTHFDEVVLDVPSGVNSVSFTGLNEASRIHYVLTPDSLSLRSYREALKLFQRFQLGSKGEMSLILNRTHSKSELTDNDISKLLDTKIKAQIRADFFSVQPAINMGVPFISKRNEKLSSNVMKDVKRYAEKVLKER